MVDPCTVLQTGVAVGELVKIFNDVRKYCKKLSNAPEDISIVLATLDDGFHLTLLAIQQVLDERSKTSVPEASQIDGLWLGALTQAAKKCEETLTKIDKILERFMDKEGSITVTERIKFVHREPKIEKYMQQLDRLKKSLELAYGGLMWHDQRRDSTMRLSDSSDPDTITIAIDVTKVLQDVNLPQQPTDTTQQAEGSQGGSTFISLAVPNTTSTLPTTITSSDLGKQLVEAFKCFKLTEVVESPKLEARSIPKPVSQPPATTGIDPMQQQGDISETQSSSPPKDSPMQSPEPGRSSADCLDHAPSPDVIDAGHMNNEQSTTNGDDVSPFHDAVHGSQTREVETMLKAGSINVNATAGKHQSTALHIAAQLGSLQMTELLLHHHADVNAKDSLNRTALSIATDNNYSTIVQALLNLRGDEINTASKHDHDESILHSAVKHQDTTSASTLLDFDPALLNQENRSSQAPLHYAAEHMHIDQVSLLLERGADANEADDCQRTPMNLALEGCDYRGNEMLELLESHGGDTGALKLTGKQRSNWEYFESYKANKV